MSHPAIHARSSVRKFGGVEADYLPLHAWFDQTKAHIPDARHRMLLHNSFGIFLAEQQFGVMLTLSNGRPIPTRLVAEQHVREDFGFIPTLEQALRNLPLEPWMYQGAAAISRDPVTHVKAPTPESRVPEETA